MTLYAVGDIHGQLGQLELALARIEADGGPDARVVFVGDYTDRGPDSRGVLDLLVEGLTAGRNWVAIKGNHDRMFQRFLEMGEVHDDRIASGKGWLHRALGGQRTLASYADPEAASFAHPANGGIETLLSYDVEIDGGDRLERVAEAARAAVPDAHLRFLQERPLMHREGELLFVHAGVRPGVALDAQDEDDLLWIRDPFLMDERDHGPLIVHGHTALDAPEAYPNRVNIDGGAGYGRELVPVAFEGREAFALTAAERERLRPA
ncbi:metallophosphoesterase family protein [Wenxinia marina]|uniref:Calcineurin-like phosphoesterase n=1 Tax=Wenxinia marina DSM 24838 TaxID=1123501 RepID=A0A0D0NRC7_9RHOB|nr:metallophosphoesterase family protein [Wenxinia marina]KIQ70750.1 Calcineurin-like phosphoesterase [Wenxinia marina DSM 24838]GGL80444.1 serine/threonine protein phosphatase [Wenxinia marina]